MSTLLEMRIDELEEQNAALAAQNAELSRLLFAAEKQTAQLTLIALGELSINQVRSDAGRDGYLQGHLDAMGDPDEIDKEHAAHRAKQHKASILAGKE